jgi:hypothetical protein
MLILCVSSIIVIIIPFALANWTTYGRPWIFPWMVKTQRQLEERNIIAELQQEKAELKEENKRLHQELKEAYKNGFYR